MANVRHPNIQQGVNFDKDFSEMKVPRAKYRIKFDSTKCTWCRCCELICSLYHEGTCNLTLSRINISVNQFVADVRAYFCTQCPRPACLFACPVEGAMKIDTMTGARVILEDKCIGCGKCAEACPINTENRVVRYNAEKKVYIKCDLCGGKPQCVEMCPGGALKYVKIRGG